MTAYCTAAAALDPTDVVDLYWAGRTTMVTRREQIPVYDRVFRRFFLDEAERLPEPLRSVDPRDEDAQAVLQIPATEPGRDGHDDEEARLGLMASDVEVLRSKSFAACTPDELAALRRIMARMRLTPPRRRTRRTSRAHPRAHDPTCAAPSARRCARMASPPGCSGAGDGSACGR